MRRKGWEEGFLTKYSRLYCRFGSGGWFWSCCLWYFRGCWGYSRSRGQGRFRWSSWFSSWYNWFGDWYNRSNGIYASTIWDRSWRRGIGWWGWEVGDTSFCCCSWRLWWCSPGRGISSRLIPLHQDDGDYNNYHHNNYCYKCSNYGTSNCTTWRKKVR